MSTGTNKQYLRHPDRFFIGGEWVEPSFTSRIDVRDSATEEVFLSVAEARVEDVDRAVASARKAFDQGPWPRMTHAERAVWLNRIADAWVKRAFSALASVPHPTAICSTAWRGSARAPRRISASRTTRPA